jgi:hypothetical protein
MNFRTLELKSIPELNAWSLKRTSSGFGLMGHGEVAFDKPSKLPGVRSQGRLKAAKALSTQKAKLVAFPG